MKRILTLIVLISSLSGASYSQTRMGYAYNGVPFTNVKVSPESFWGQRLQAAREVTVPLAFSKCESEHRYKNFSMAAYTLAHPGHPGLSTPEWDVSKFMGFSFDDTDVYKTIEGASYLLQTFPDKKMEAYIDSILDIVRAAQEPDGYLYTARTINPAHPHGWAGAKRWEKTEVLSHELYNLGHLTDAACAHYQATGSRKMLDIACRYADCVIRAIGPEADKLHIVPGHQIAEMALARLYIITGEKRYLDEAKYLLDARGRTPYRNQYSQSDKPVTEQTEAWGHAVRAGYMYSGMADVAALTGDSAYINAIDKIWENIVSRKYYITGGVGARHAGEAYGADYELPNKTAYNETCAAISIVYFAQRMFQFRGDAKYIDCLERTLYNGVISGMSVDGGRFFYPNPLSSDGEYRFNADGNTTRQPWFGCACCPSNLCRFIPSLPGYMYATDNSSVYVNLFADNEAQMTVNGKGVTLKQTTRYPWDGDISIKVKQNKAGRFAMKIRIPGWARGEAVPSSLYSFTDKSVKGGFRVTVVEGKKEIDVTTAGINKGYLTVDRKWKKGDEVRIHFDMPVREIVADSHVMADRGRVAIQRGPLVYCAETADNKGHDVLHTVMPKNATFGIVDNYRIENTESGAGAFSVTALTVPTQTIETTADGKWKLSDVKLTMIPYYAWNHRGTTRMCVWMPQTPDMLDE
ncbi:MAG: glycoside hydrolase family 127 protein [Prevotella sp.]|nr:glycoside hydrolase family 127 protein [Prevotella sp.]